MPKRRPSLQYFLGEPHAIGSHRSVYVHPDRVGLPESVNKVAHSHYPKRIGPWRMRLPMKWHALHLYWARDINHVEMNNYLKYFARPPVSLRDCFARVLEVRKNSPSVLHMDAIHDYDGRMSLTLAQMRKLSNPSFWKKFDEMFDWMMRKNIPFFDFNPNNFVVKFTSSQTCVPVLVDYKSATYRPFLLRPWVRIPAVARRKMRIRYAKLKREFCAD